MEHRVATVPRKLPEEDTAGQEVTQDTQPCTCPVACALGQGLCCFRPVRATVKEATSM